MFLKNNFLIVVAIVLLTGCSQTTVKPTHSDTKSDSGSDKIFNLPYLMRDLDNGLRVIVVATDYPDVVTVQIPVQTGSRNEVEEGKSGFAHFFEHMMFRGTPNYSADKYGEILKNAGADQNAYTTDDYTNYHTTVTKDDLETLLMLEADRFKNLSFTEAEFRTEALAVKGEYLKNSANPISKIFETVRDNAFDKHTYKHTTMGFFRDIEEMPNQMEYAKLFFDRWYRPEKTTVIVVGDVDEENTFQLVRKYFGDWERGSFSEQIPQETEIGDSVYKHIKWSSKTQPWLTMAFHGPADNPQQSLDKQSLDLLLRIYFGNTSELYQEIVTNKRLADQFFAYYPSRKDPGLIYLAARLTDSENYSSVQQAIVDTIVKARTELVEQNKLDDIKSAARYGFATSLDNSATIGAILASVVQMNRTPELLNQQFAALKKVMPSDLKNVANKYLIDEGRVIVSLSEAEDVPALQNELNLQKLVTEADKPLSNSFKVVDMRNSSPIIDINLLFNTGAAYEDSDKNGVAELTAAMLTDGGSKLYSATEISKKMFPMSASFGHQIDKEMLRFTGRVHQEKADEWLDLVIESLTNPGFRDDDFSRLKQQQVNAIVTDLKGNNDEELGKEVLYHKLYQGHPYETTNLGDVSELEEITIDDVRNFYRNQLTQSNLTIGVTGNLSDKQLDKLKSAISKKLQKGEANQRIAQAPELKGRSATIVEKDTLATAVSFGFPIDITRADKDWAALWLVRSFFGEHRNSNSHLYGQIREKRGMNYGDYAYIEYFPRGMFRTQPNANLSRSSQIFQVWLRPLRDNNDAHFATRVAMYELHHLLKHGLTEEQFEATRNYLMKYAGLLVKSQDRILGYALDSEFYGIDEFTKYVKQNLENLTLEQVNEVINKYLQEDNVHFVFISKDANDMKNRLASEQTSPITYNSEKPEEILKKDQFLQDFPLSLDANNIKIVPVEEVFQ